MATKAPTLLRLMRYVAGHWFLATVSLMMVVAVSGLGLVQPLVVRWAIDSAIGQGQVGVAVAGALAIVGVAVLRGVAMFVQRYTMELSAQKVSYRLRGDLYRHLQELSFSFYDRARTGELMSRLTGDVDSIYRFVGMGFIWIGGGVLGFAGGLMAMVYIHPTLAAASLAFMPVLLYTVLRFSGSVRPQFGGIREQQAQMNAVLQESISGVRVVRAFAREEHEIGRFDRENRENYVRQVRLGRTLSYYANYMNFLSAIGPAVTLLVGGSIVLAGKLSLGSLAAMGLYLSQITMPVRMFGFVIAMYQMAMASGKRIFDILDTRSDIVDAPGATPLPPVRGSVRVENVTFEREGKRILDSIDLDVAPGEIVAILGPTGSGKSSLVNLIPRFYDPSSGRVLIDGHDIKKVTVDSLRRQVAVVSQDVFLFSTSIRENISYGRPGAPLADVIEAAKAAQIHDFIVGLPDGYDTVVGERGIGLSGGQKQRVSIARAILMKAPVVILDESLSSVDAETESRIQAAFSRLLKGRTCFIVAQRLSTVRLAHRLLVLNQGRIAEQGTHDDLLAAGGLYASIFQQNLLGETGAGGGAAAGGSDAVAGGGEGGGRP
ncbi:MAG: ABC transporter ATP-binding protein [Firmicutes bacterium]|nr:ABC transporter ATP-binding protein [Bacillota bacterium]